MEIYKKAAMTDHKILTVKGAMSPAQLYKMMNLEELDQLVVSIDEQLEKAPKKSFLTAQSKTDEKLQLSFDIALDVLKTKAAEMEADIQRKLNKKHAEPLLAEAERRKLEGISKLSDQELADRIAAIS